MDEIGGWVAQGYEQIGEVFAATLRDPPGGGAACCAYVDGRKVVDLWGGEARPGVAWTKDTLAPVFSVTKGATAFVCQVLADRGELEVDAPVARYWPEFAAKGKAGITVRDVLAHSAGVPYFPGYERIVSWDAPDGWGRTEEIVRGLAGAPPVWAPRSQHGYHMLSYGWLLGEVVRRVTGTTLGAFFREEIARPLGLDFWIGLPQEDRGRVAALDPAPIEDAEVAAAIESVFTPETLTGRAAFLGPLRKAEGLVPTADSEGFQAAEVPAANGVTDAESVARLYALLACGGELGGARLVSPESVARHAAEQVRGFDACLLTETRIALGYARPAPGFHQLGPHDELFGHRGLGGSVAFADPASRVGFGYVTSRFVWRLDDDPRARALAEALYAALG